MDSLLQDLKDKLNITWDEEDTERKLNMIIEDAKLTLNYKLGYSIDSVSYTHLRAHET